VAECEKSNPTRARSKRGGQIVEAALLLKQEKVVSVFLHGWELIRVRVYHHVNARITVTRAALALVSRSAFTTFVVDGWSASFSPAPSLQGGGKWRQQHPQIKE